MTEGRYTVRRKRRDKVQSEVVRVLRRLGASVVITADVGGGFPDLVVGYRGVTYLIASGTATVIVTYIEQT